MHPTSEILSRNLSYFVDKNILICGFWNDHYITEITKVAKTTNIWCTDFTQYQSLCNYFNIEVDTSKVINFYQKTLDNKICIFFGTDILSIKNELKDINTALLNITKTKQENKFYINYICHIANLCQQDYILYTVGSNDEGIRGTETLLKTFSHTNKIDNARKCLLLATIINKDNDKYQPIRFTYKDLSIGSISLKLAFLPGIFSFGELDLGTKLLLETVSKERFTDINSILDVGCGTGIIGIYLSLLMPKLEINSCDINAFAIACTIESSKINNVVNNIFLSDMLTNANKYNLIITNPPFHIGKKQLIQPTIDFINNIPKHLKGNKATTYIVANSFLPYTDALKKSFYNIDIVENNNKFKVYKCTSPIN
ncbi:MAG: methyltransferase [Succinivibrionaceae bacterium]